LLLDRLAGKHRLDLRPISSGIAADPFKKEALAFLSLLLAWPAKHGCRLSPA
jgi:hypothetical protein